VRTGTAVVIIHTLYNFKDMQEATSINICEERRGIEKYKYRGNVIFSTLSHNNCATVKTNVQNARIIA